MAEVEGSNTRFYSRNGLSYSKAYPKIYNQLVKLDIDAGLDGDVFISGWSAIFPRNAELHEHREFCLEEGQTVNVHETRIILELETMRYSGILMTFFK